MFKEIVVKLQKCTLVLSESDIWKLPSDILEKAIKKGKALKRCERVEKYEESKIYPTTKDVYGERS